ncbi:MAG: hypothetical protein U0694_24710, partial [Anaerolineae bacterium]
MALVLMIIVGGVVVYLWLWAWSQERRKMGRALDIEQMLEQVSSTDNHNEAVLISREHGQIVFANESARRWAGLNGGEPNLETIAAKAQPSDSFLELFASERQSSFQLGGRWIEASSHRVPVGQELRTVVVMRELSATSASADGLDLSKAMNIINEIGDTLNTSLGQEQTVQAILTIAGKYIPAEAGEIALWSEHTRMLQQHGWIGDTMYLLQLAEAGNTYKPGEGIAGWVAQHRRPLLIEDRRDPSSIQ